MLFRLLIIVLANALEYDLHSKGHLNCTVWVLLGGFSHKSTPSYSHYTLIKALNQSILRENFPHSHKFR